MEPFHYTPAADAGLVPADRWKSVRREPGLISVIARRIACAIADGYLKLYHRIEVVGRENVPKDTPFVVIANHESHLDVFVLAAALPRAMRHRVFPIAAGDVFFVTPAVSAFSAAFINALPMWRKAVGAHALDDLKARLRSGDCGYILFPAGARSRDGSLLKFKAGIGMMTAGTNIPVVPCRLEGLFEALPPGRVLPRPVKMRVRIGPPMTFADQPDSREGWNAIATALQARVESLANA